MTLEQPALPYLNVISAVDSSGAPLRLIEEIRIGDPSSRIFTDWKESEEYFFAPGTIRIPDRTTVFPMTLMRLKRDKPRGLFLVESNGKGEPRRYPIATTRGNLVGIYFEVPSHLDGKGLLSRVARRLVAGCWEGNLLDPHFGESEDLEGGLTIDRWIGESPFPEGYSHSVLSQPEQFGNRAQS